MKKIYIIISIIAITLKLSAQDIHFSQYYASPLLLNPAMTGHIEGSYRIKAIYRNQWASISSGGVYATPAVSFDINFRQGETPNSIGGGLAVFSDKGGSYLNTFSFLASMAYHFNLDGKEKTYLSAGIQGGIVSKRLDVADIVFKDELDGNGNPTQSTNEQFDVTDISGTDISAGVILSGYPNQKTNYKIGVGVLHLLKMNETFLGSNDNRLPMRLVFHGEGSFTMTEKISLLPHFLFMSQSKVTQIHLGSNVSYRVSPDMAALAGAGFRMGDAAILVLGFDFKGINIGMSYDLNVSSLQTASNGQGGYEISLGYIGRILKPATPIYPAVRYF